MYARGSARIIWNAFTTQNWLVLFICNCENRCDHVICPLSPPPPPSVINFRNRGIGFRRLKSRKRN